MKKASRELVALMEEKGDKIRNWDYDGKGNNYTILMHIKKHANAEYDSPDETFTYFKEIMRSMKFVKEAQIKGVSWKEVWEHFREDNNEGK